MRTVYCFDPAFLKHFYKLINLGTTLPGLFIADSAAAGVDHIHSVFLQTVQLFLHAFIGGGVTLAAIAM
jgi:hypothetical protein